MLSQVKLPLMLHCWAPCSAPQFTGYWGTENVDAVMGTAQDILKAHPDQMVDAKSHFGKNKELALAAV